jgi:hypothetical protein
MKYTLWDVEAGKQIALLDREDEAFSRVRILLDHYGDAYADELALGRVADNGAVLEPLTGAELVSRTRQVDEPPSVIATRWRSGIRHPAGMAAAAAAWVARRKADASPKRRDRSH